MSYDGRMRRRALFAILAGASATACALISGASDLEVVEGPVAPPESGASSSSSTSSSSSASSSSGASSSSSSGGERRDASEDAAIDAPATCSVATFGPYRCGTATGTAWQVPLEACAKDGSSAVSNGSPLPLALSEFGFAVPDGATIKGIRVEITRRWTINTVQGSTFGFRDKGTTKSSGAWSSSYATVSYGGPTDLWGAAWQAADFTDGLVFELTAGSNGYANVDDVAITIYACP